MNIKWLCLYSVGDVMRFAALFRICPNSGAGGYTGIPQELQHRQQNSQRKGTVIFVLHKIYLS
jgi:hypothetical protein